MQKYNYYYLKVESYFKILTEDYGITELGLK